MGENSKIEWCDHTFNPWVGCEKISPACDYCYAEGWAKRAGQPELWSGQRRLTSVNNWKMPARWDSRAVALGTRLKVFCASLADVFDNKVPSGWRNDLWRVIHATPNLDWLLLTKRPQNIAKMLPDPATGVPEWGNGWPNVWLGTTVENQPEANRRLPHILAIPAVVHFVSCEPLLGPIDFVLRGNDIPGWDEDWKYDVLRGKEWTDPRDDAPPSSPKIDWVIDGGETGANARPAHPDWFRSLRDQCRDSGTAYFHKQNGVYLHSSEVAHWPRHVCEAFFRGNEPWKYDNEVGSPSGWWRVDKKRAGRLLDGREWSEFPR